jgi:hypothetical protein
VPAAAAGGATSPTVSVKKSKSQLRFRAKLRLAVLARPAGAAIDRVAFMIDGRWVHTDATRPFSLVWRVPRGTRYGTHTLTIKAFAKDGTFGRISVKVRRVRAPSR